MTEDLAKKVVAWATEVARHAAQLPSREARDSYLTERHRELVTGAIAQGTARHDAVVLADASVEAARRILTALVGHSAGKPKQRLN